MRMPWTTAILLLLSTRPGFSSDVPDPAGSYCQVSGEAFVITPDGSGSHLGDQGVFIDVWVLDVQLVPIVNFPREDIWFDDDTSTGSLTACLFGTAADANTDIQGHTTISGPVFGGGGTTTGLFVFAAPYMLPTEPLGPPVLHPIQVNSPDINGDLSVDISDITMFANDLGGYRFQSDFNHDGSVDLSDITLFSGWIGTSCP